MNRNHCIISAVGCVLFVLALVINAQFLSQKIEPVEAEEGLSARPRDEPRTPKIEAHTSGNVVNQSKAFSPPQEEVTGLKNAARTREEELNEFRARYVNEIPRPSLPFVAVVASSTDRRSAGTTASGVVQLLPQDKVAASSFLFTPAFVEDGLFDEMLRSGTSTTSKLDLQSRADAVLLVREHVEYTTNRDLASVMTAVLRLEVKLLPLSQSVRPWATNVTAMGAGFNEGAARALAEERLFKQLSSVDFDSLVIK